jgi:antitoxin HicB
MRAEEISVTEQGRSFTINLNPQPEGGFTVLVPALPEVVTEGEAREEALANAREAIEAMLAVYREEGWPIPADVPTEVEHLTVAA